VKEQAVKKSLGTPRSKRVDNIKMDLTDIGIGGMNVTDLVHDRWALLDMVINLMAPIKSLVQLGTTGSFSIRAQPHEITHSSTGFPSSCNLFTSVIFIIRTIYHPVSHSYGS
jgi:hypothetical protein